MAAWNSSCALWHEPKQPQNSLNPIFIWLSLNTCRLHLQSEVMGMICFFIVLIILHSNFFPLKSNLPTLINNLAFTWSVIHFQDAFLDFLALNSGTNHETVNLFTVSPEQEEEELKKPSLLPHLQQPWKFESLFHLPSIWDALILVAIHHHVVVKFKGPEESSSVPPQPLCPYAPLKLTFTEIRFLQILHSTPHNCVLALGCWLLA